jgi:hypothetical protein
MVLFIIVQILSNDAGVFMLIVSIPYEIQTVINEKNQNPNSVKNTEYSRILFSYAQKLLSE